MPKRTPIQTPSTARNSAPRAPRKRRRAPGTWGSVEQLPSKRWRAFYRLDGAKIGAPSTFPTKEAAHAWLATERADHTRGVWRDPRQATVTLADYADAWLDTRTDLRPRTVQLYRDALRRYVLPPLGKNRQAIELGRVPLTSITPALVRLWFATVHDTARTAGQARTARAPRTSHPARAWALSTGLPVALSGRLSPATLTAWERAGRPDVRPAAITRDVPAADPGRTAAAQAYRLLHSILATAVREGTLTANPCQVPGAGNTKPRERGTASPAEVTAVSKAMPAHLAVSVLVAAWSGLRYGELFALARRHVDLAAGTVHVERAVLELTGQPISFGPTKTTRSARLVHLPGFVAAALAEHMTQHVAASPNALLFTTTIGTPVSKTRLHAAFNRARLSIDRRDLAWHDLRHTGATLAYRAGASVPEVQARLGHTTARAAMIYAHTADDSDQVLAGRLDALFSSLALDTPA